MKNNWIILLILLGSLAGIEAQNPLLKATGIANRANLWSVAGKNQGQNRPTAVESGSASFAGLTISNSLFIFHHTESAVPGDYIALQGHFPADAEVGLRINNRKNYLLLRPLQQGNGIFQTRIPPDLPPGQYEIFVKTGNLRSKAALINHPVADCFNSPQVYSGADMVVKGRDLVMPGQTPTIRFVQQGSGAVSYGTYEPKGSYGFKLRFKAPRELVAGKKYTVFVSNGFGEAQVKDMLTAIAPATDYYQLRVAFHASFTAAIVNNVYDLTRDNRLAAHMKPGDATTNYRDAIQAAIDQASADGGGVVKIPKGTYQCTGTTGTGLTLKSNVILEGAGQDQTTLEYAGFKSRFLFSQASDRTIGLANIRLVNKSEGGDAAEKSAAAIFNNDVLFLKNVRWNVGVGDRIFIRGSNNVVIQNLKATETKAGLGGPLRVSGCRYATVQESEFSLAQAVQFVNADRCFIEDNKFIRNNGIPVSENPPTTVHIITNEFMSNSLVAGNQFLVANGANARIAGRDPNGHRTKVRNNDGESIISEGGGPKPPFLHKGNVTSATATTLTDADQHFGAIENRPYVSIIRGKGMGQVRKITAVTGTTLSLATAWDIMPDQTSVYATFCFGLQDVVYYNNRFENQQRGITLYKTALSRVDLVKNTLINSGAIDLQPTQNIRNHGKTFQFTPVYDVSLVGNEGSSVSDQYQGCSMGLQVIQDRIAETWGTACIGLRMKNNTLRQQIPNQLVIVEDNYYPSFNAYMTFFRKTSAGTNPATYFKDNGVPLILGTIIQDCTVQNAEKPVSLGTGTYYTLIAGLKKMNSAANTVFEKKPVPAPGEPAPSGSQYTLTLPE
ncbi:pectate lyase-like protein [Larkinella arboricola]|uniref:Pectate lyase-like protein n=1 Tax=Larkinella arboricola TaxID=643671 RepID=A0A327X2F7_LARAB|nr:glycosyl hydrolase family 28-related protein [Larkinella arboricola]RAK00310.1 pectate lyase-like protein [Larkinella arboricola]